MSDQSSVTVLLQNWQAGDDKALEELTPVIYQELKRLARSAMRGERNSHTLQATALVNEAYMRLVDANVAWKDRVHFYAVAARMMRRILVDHARARSSAKRGSGRTNLPLEEALVVGVTPNDELLDLDDALVKLAAFDERKAHLVELIYFGGLTYEEAAEALAVSPVTVHRDLKVAKAWLYNVIQNNHPDA